MKKKFNLQDWLKDQTQRVETVDGRNVRILCVDAKSADRDDDIVAMVQSSDGTENIQRYYSDGTLIADSARKGLKDLVIVDNNEDTIEEMLFNIFDEYVNVYSKNKDKYAFLIDDWMKRIITVLKKLNKKC